MQLLCGKCGRTTEVDDQTLEAVVKCEHCEHEIPVPGQGEGLLGDGGEAETPEEDFARQAREAMERKIRVICGSCRRGLKASIRMAGVVIRCPSCDRKVRIPFPDEAEPAPTASEVGTEAPGNPDVQVDDDVLVDEPASNLLSDLEDAQAPPRTDGMQVASSTHVGRGRRERQGTSNGPAIPTKLLLTAVGLALAAVGGWLWLTLLTDNKDKPVGPDRRAAKTPMTTAPVAGGNGKSASVPVVKIDRPETKPGLPAPERTGAVQLAEIKCEVFLANGWGVAPPGMAYLKLRLTLQAGEAPVALRSAGNDIRLSAGGKTFASLGRPGPFGPVDEPVRLASRAKAAVQVVFLVPEQAMAGACELGVGSLPPASVKGVELPSAGQLAVGETYHESPPRNLQPLLRDPVMRAIQAAGDQKLIVARKDRELEVSIPGAEVSGLAKIGAGGAYDVTLYRQGEPKGLRCTMRPVKDGTKSLLLLYLSDEPFHQICYALPDRPVEPPPSVPVDPPANDGGGGFFNPAKVAPKPEPKPDPAPKPDAKPNGGGLFDFGN